MPTLAIPSYPVLLSPVRPMFAAQMPVPPGVNETYKIVTYGRRHRLALTEKALTFKSKALEALKDASVYDYSLVNAVREAAKRKGPNQKPPLELYIKFQFSHLWTRDVDGGIKIVQDTLFHYLQLDDRLVTNLITTKEQSSEPRTTVELRCFVPSHQQ